MRSWLPGLLALACISGFVAATCGQTRVTGSRTGAVLDRPSSRGASLQLGGRFTRARRGLQTPQRQVSMFGQDAFQFSRTYQNRGRGAAAQSRLPRSLAIAQTGLRMPLGAPRGATLSWTGYRTGAASIVPGMVPVLSVAPPTMDHRGRRLPTVDAHLYTPDRHQTRFHRLVGLNATPEGPATPAFDNLTDELIEHNERRVQRAEQRALFEFEQGTVEARDPETGRFPNCRECPLHLDRARELLQIARDMTPDEHIPSLLLAHDALERERPSLATYYLVEAYRREPTLFAEDDGDESARNVHRYYGDVDDDGRSAIVAAQMRRYVRLGDLNSSEPSAWLLSAYCAWQLGDMTRAATAADRVLELGRGAEDIERMAPVLSMALELQQQTRR